MMYGAGPRRKRLDDLTHKIDTTPKTEGDRLMQEAMRVRLREIIDESGDGGDGIPDSSWTQTLGSALARQLRRNKDT